MISQLVIATSNAGKEMEIRKIFSGLQLQILSLKDFPKVPEVIEDGDTLEANALKKARQVHRETSLPALADDTGLEVFALKMQPGVRSARYAGESVSYKDNNLKLLTELARIPPDKRQAQFRCVAAYCDGTLEKTIEGICHGTITADFTGSGGFGYDPLFIPDGSNKAFAELSLEEKNLLSHRGKAFREMRKFLESLLVS